MARIHSSRGPVPVLPLVTLSIVQSPEVVPPQVQTTATYHGGTAVRLPDAPSPERADALLRQVEDLYRPSFPARR
jgi:hypothetical protein